MHPSAILFSRLLIHYFLNHVLMPFMGRPFPQVSLSSGFCFFTFAFISKLQAARALEGEEILSLDGDTARRIWRKVLLPDLLEIKSNIGLFHFRQELS